MEKNLNRDQWSVSCYGLSMNVHVLFLSPSPVPLLLSLSFPLNLPPPSSLSSSVSPSLSLPPSLPLSHSLPFPSSLSPSIPLSPPPSPSLSTAIIEHVCDGSTLRVILLPSYTCLTLAMSGVKVSKWLPSLPSSSNSLNYLHVHVHVTCASGWKEPARQCGSFEGVG